MNYLLVQITSFADFNYFLLDAHFLCAANVKCVPQVDVIFPEDVGFLAAIKTFMSTTKRPIILTTNGEQCVTA